MICSELVLSVWLDHKPGKKLKRVDISSDKQAFFVFFVGEGYFVFFTALCVCVCSVYLPPYFCFFRLFTAGYRLIFFVYLLPFFVLFIYQRLPLFLLFNFFVFTTFFCLITGLQSCLFFFFVSLPFFFFVYLLCIITFFLFIYLPRCFFSLSPTGYLLIFCLLFCFVFFFTRDYLLFFVYYGLPPFFKNNLVRAMAFLFLFFFHLFAAFLFFLFIYYVLPSCLFFAFLYIYYELAPCFFLHSFSFVHYDGLSPSLFPFYLVRITALFQKWFPKGYSQLFIFWFIHRQFGFFVYLPRFPAFFIYHYFCSFSMTYHLLFYFIDFSLVVYLLRVNSFFIYLLWDNFFPTLEGTSLKLVDRFTYIGSSVSSTEKDINTRLT